MPESSKATYERGCAGAEGATGHAAASLRAGPRHGYAVREALRTAGSARFDLPTGTIYPALRPLEAGRLVDGTWSEAGIPHRPNYRHQTKRASTVRPVAYRGRPDRNTR